MYVMYVFPLHVCSMEMVVINSLNVLPHIHHNVVLRTSSPIYKRNTNDFLTDIDADLHILNQRNSNECQYYNISTFNNKINVTQNISLIHTNIRSSNKNLKDFIYYIDSLNTKFSFIALSEVWGDSITISQQHISDYVHLYDTRENRSGGGCSLYINKTIPFIKRTDLQFKNHIKQIKKVNINQLFENVVIEVNKNIFNSRKNIIICVLYRAPNSCMKTFNEELEWLLNCIEKEKKIAYFLADYNINTLCDQAQSILSQEFVDLYSSLDYRKLINIPTRVQGNSATLIDNIYTNIACDSETNGVLITDITDHYSPFSIRHHTPTPVAKKYRTVRDFSEKNISKLKKSFKNNDWLSLYSDDDAQHAFTHFINFAKDSFDSYCPFKDIRIKYENRHPWVNAEIKHEIANREKLLITKKLNPTPQNREKHRVARNNVTSMQN